MKTQKCWSLLKSLMVMMMMSAAFMSCNKDNDDDKKNNSNSDFFSADNKAFHNGMTNNAGNTVIVDIREAKDYEVSHIKDAVNIYPGKDVPEANSDFYKKIKDLDPNYEKFLLLYSNGTSYKLTKIATQCAKMGWGAKNTFCLTKSYDEYAKVYPDDIETAQGE